MCSPLHSRARARRDRKWLPRLAALMALLVPLATAGLEEDKMTIKLSSPESKDYLTVEPDLRPLAQGDYAAFAPATPPPPEAASGYVARGGNNARNGRSGATLPQGDWALAWEHEIRQGQLPEAVLSAGERILVQTGVWQLFDTGGNLIKEGSSGFGAATLDPARGLFYHINRDADVIARNLSDGEQIFALMPFLGEEFERPLIHRLPERVLIVGKERQLDPHGHHKASRSLLEWVDLGTSLETSVSGLLQSARNAGTLILPTTAFMAAADGGTVAGASSGRLYVSGAEPRLEAVFEGAFEPLRLSLGGNGVVYLVVLSGDDLYLWCVSLDGKLLRRFAFPEGTGSPVVPPIVGFDNRVFIATTSRVLALSAKAEPLWEWKTEGPIIGATCTADGTLAVVTERELGLLSDKGEYTRINRSVEAPYATAPCVTEAGMIVAATPGTVQAFHCP